MPRPCVGCGFEVDENEDLVHAGIQEREFAYGTQPPDYTFCDPASGRAWHKPFNLPWGRYFSRHASAGLLGFPISGVAGSVNESNLAEGRANASLLVETPWVQVEPTALDSPLRNYSSQFECYFANGSANFTVTYVRLLRDRDNGGGVVTETAGEWELGVAPGFDSRPFVVATDDTNARRVKWRLLAFWIGLGPVFAVRVNAICRDEGPPITGILGNHEPGAGTYYG